MSRPPALLWVVCSTPDRLRPDRLSTDRFRSDMLITDMFSVLIG